MTAGWKDSKKWKTPWVMIQGHSANCDNSKRSWGACQSRYISWNSLGNLNDENPYRVAGALQHFLVFWCTAPNCNARVGFPFEYVSDQIGLWLTEIGVEDD